MGKKLKANNNDVEESFIYDATRGGVFCDRHFIAPWPGVIFRRIALLECMKQLTAPLPDSHLLEIGFGSGRFAYEFHRQGYRCTGYDFNWQAVEVADDIFNKKSKIIDFKNHLTESDKEKYDYLAAFEVLEHNEDDVSVLNEWKQLLKPGGYTFISVPARMKHWSDLDERAGHIRRYEREGLRSLLTNNGFEVIRLVNWGFPFWNVTRPLRNALISRPVLKQIGQLSPTERTKLSGINCSREYRYKKFIPFRLLNLIGKAQRIFFDFDLGDGYLVVAKRVI